MKALRGLARLWQSLYARIALVYLASLLLLSMSAAWIAVGQFDRLGREMEQRMQIDLAGHLAQVMAAPLSQGAGNAAAENAAQRILTINPSLSLYVLDKTGGVVGDYTDTGCKTLSRVDVDALSRMLKPAPMLPVFVGAPCTHQPSVFSVARVHYGESATPGYLLAILDTGPRMSMFAMLRTSSIARTLLIAGSLVLLVSGAVGLALFALLTHRFSALTHAVQRFADGDYGQRIDTRRADEIGRLGRAFNDMAATIEAQLEALRENDRQRRELVANLSHDFRTPLTSLQGYAEQLRARDDLPVETRNEHLGAILTNVERLTGLARQLSTLACVDAFGGPLCAEPFSIAELVQDVAGKFRPQAQKAHVALEVQCALQLPRVTADLALIDRALTNLIDNAVHATPAGGMVCVRVRRRGNHVVLCVVDTGIGLSAEEVPLVTQRFYRTAAGRAASEGSGLGLAIVKEICERHGCRLRIDSTPGAGTHIRFELPVA